MPIDYKKYPANWMQLREQVLERANHCCEWPECNIPNYETGYRDKNGKWYSYKTIDDALNDTGYDYFENELKNCFDKKGNPTKPIKIVLTVAHLDHDETNPDVNIVRLRAYCQYHHLNYDKEEKKRRRKLKKRQTELF